MSNPTEKSIYQSPTLIEYGELSEMTHGTYGPVTDGVGGYQPGG